MSDTEPSVWKPGTQTDHEASTSHPRQDAAQIFAQLFLKVVVEVL